MKILNDEALTWAKLFAISGAIMPFVMMVINYFIKIFIAKTTVEGVTVTFSVAEVNLRNAIATGGQSGQISSWLAGLFGYSIPDVVANLPGAGFTILGIPASAFIIGGLIGAVAGIVAHTIIKNIKLIDDIVPNNGYGIYFGHVLVASLIGYGIVLLGTGLPDFIGATTIGLSMIINAVVHGYVLQQIAKYV